MSVYAKIFFEVEREDGRRERDGRGGGGQVDGTVNEAFIVLC